MTGSLGPLPARRGRTDDQPCPAAQATGRRGTMWMIWVYGQDGQGLHRGKARSGGESVYQHRYGQVSAYCDRRHEVTSKFPRTGAGSWARWCVLPCTSPHLTPVRAGAAAGKQPTAACSWAGLGWATCRRRVGRPDARSRETMDGRRGVSWSPPGALMGREMHPDGVDCGQCTPRRKLR